MLGATATKLHYFYSWYNLNLLKTEFKMIVLDCSSMNTAMMPRSGEFSRFLFCKSSINTADVDQDIFGDSDSDQSYHGFTAQELNESVPREDISVKEHSSESVYIF